MKKSKLKYVFFIFLFILVTGIVCLVIPFDFEKYSYNDVDKEFLFSGYKVSFTLNNYNKEFEDVDIVVKYTLLHHLKNEEFTETIQHINLKTGENKLNFSFNDPYGDAYLFDNVTAIQIKGNNFTIDVNKKALLTGPNFYFFGLTVIGFFGSAVSLIFWLVTPKVTKITQEAQHEASLLGERLNQVFTNFSGNNKKDKLTCPFCKASYSADLDKCPHCGAPPESND